MPGTLRRAGIVAIAVAACANVATAADAPYESAAQCGECHQAIHDSWSESAHAKAATSPAFLAALDTAGGAAQGSPGTRRDCVWCHAPTTLVTGDIELKQPVSSEGVTCDFCHTVDDVDLERRPHPFRLDPGPVKRGPFAYESVMGHPAEYSPLHKSSPLLCASCHEFRNARGVAVLSTYSEWKAGPYPARGVPCQDCHMSLVRGAITKTMPGPATLRLVNLHRVVGGSSRAQVDRGLDLAIESFTRSGNSVALTVTVKNVAAGHPVPGGLSTKSLALEAGFEGEGDALRGAQERVYRRELKDARGRVLTSVADLFANAASVGADNRIKPMETRRERFTLTAPADARVVIVRLRYRDRSDPRAARPAETTVTEIRRPL